MWAVYELNERGTLVMAGHGQTSYGTLFELLRAFPETTRTELVNMSGLSKATVSEAVARMIERGVLVETGKRQQERGRSQVVLAFQPAVRLVIGAQFTERGCHAVLADLRAGPVAWATCDKSADGPAGFVDALASCVDHLRVQAEAPILGLGVGVPGLVDPTGREVILSVTYGWEHVPICDMLEARLDMPVIATNRARAAALGEYWQGNHGGNREYLAYIHVGAGISAGFVNKGRLSTGAGGFAAELGHMTVLPDGPPCACGNHGCLQMLASESALLESVSSGALPLQPPGALTLDGLVAAVNDGDTTALNAVHQAGAWVGLALANVINLINPSLVVLGGSIAAFGEPFLESVRNEVHNRALRDAMQGVEIVRSSLGDQAGTIGGAALFLDTLNAEAMLA